MVVDFEIYDARPIRDCWPRPGVHDLDNLRRHGLRGEDAAEHECRESGKDAHANLQRDGDAFANHLMPDPPSTTCQIAASGACACPAAFA